MSKGLQPGLYLMLNLPLKNGATESVSDTDACSNVQNLQVCSNYHEAEVRVRLEPLKACGIWVLQEMGGKEGFA